MAYKVKHKYGNLDGKPLQKDIAETSIVKDNVTATNIIKVMPIQHQFIMDKTPELLMSGGCGSGKSLALCISLLEKAMIPGNVVLLIRKTLTDLKASTLRMLTEPEGKRPAILPKGSYNWNKSDKIIEMRGGGIIYYTGCDDPMKIRSVNAGDIFIDEASQLDKEEYDELKMRLRVDVGGLQIKLVTNPANKSHWLYKRFVLENEPYRKIIYGNSLNNIYLPQQTLDHYNTFKDSTFEKMVLGHWIALDKMIYKMFDASKHVKEFDIESMKKDITDWYISIDVGWSNPSAMVLAGTHRNGKIYIFDEFEKSQQLVGKLAYHISNWCKNISDNDAPSIICDPAAAQVINELKAKGYNVLKSPNEVESGIALVQSALDEGHIVINKKCVNLIREIEGYSRDDFGKVIKEEDHLVDSLRYLCSYLALRGAEAFSQIAPFYVPSLQKEKENDKYDNPQEKTEENWGQMYE